MKELRYQHPLFWGWVREDRKWDVRPCSAQIENQQEYLLASEVAASDN
jgi:hypothetical protein